MSDKLEKVKELKVMLEDGSITEAEFTQMKSDLMGEKKKRTGIGVPEVAAVLFGLIGGIGYLFTKQGITKKLAIFILSLITNGFYASFSESPEQADLPANNTEVISSPQNEEIEKTPSVEEVLLSANSALSEGSYELALTLVKDSDLADSRLEAIAQEAEVKIAEQKLESEKQRDEATQSLLSEEHNIGDLREKIADKAISKLEFASLPSELPPFLSDLVKQYGGSTRAQSWFSADLLTRTCNEIAPNDIQEYLEIKEHHANGRPYYGAVPTIQDVKSEAESAYYSALRCGYYALLFESEEYISKAASLIQEASKYSTDGSRFISQLKKGKI